MNASIPSSSLAIPTIPIDQITPSPSNPRKRFDETYLQELAASLLEHGMIQPITVRPLPLDHLFEYNRMNPTRGPDEVTPTYEIVVGECRWRAARLAGLTEVPAFWRDLDDKQVLEIQVIENLQRRDVHPIEEADGYRQLIDKHGYRAEDIAEKIGKSRSYVYGRMKLAALGSKARQAFFDNRVDAAVALLIARIASEKDQERALATITQHTEPGSTITFLSAKWKIRQLFTVDLIRATWPLDDQTLLPSAGSCTECPRRSGNSPEICPDIDTANVCTDVKCFEEKRLARREQLIANASALNIPIYLGDEVNQVAPHGAEFNLEERWVNVDDILDGDRTYRDVLGDQTPVGMMVEFGPGINARLKSYADETILAEALKKAEIELPSYGAGHEDEEDAAQALAAAERRQRQIDEDDERARLINSERTRRKGILQAIKNKLINDDDTLNTDNIIIALAMAHLHQRVAYEGIDTTQLRLQEFGIDMPDEFDEDVELARAAITILQFWDHKKALAYLIAETTAEEVEEVFNWGTKLPSPIPGLDALAQAVGIVAPDPADAAQASEVLLDENPSEAPRGDEFWPFPSKSGESKETPIETKGKPKGRSKAKAKAVA